RYRKIYWRKRKMSMTLLGKLELNGKKFSMQDSLGTVYIHQLGLKDNFYGGYVKEARKTKYGIYMLLNDAGLIVNLGYMPDSLTQEGKDLLDYVEEPLEKHDNSGYLEFEPFPKPLPEIPIKPTV